MHPKNPKVCCSVYESPAVLLRQEISAAKWLSGQTLPCPIPHPCRGGEGGEATLAALPLSGVSALASQKSNTNTGWSGSGLWQLRRPVRQSGTVVLWFVWFCFSFFHAFGLDLQVQCRLCSMDSSGNFAGSDGLELPFSSHHSKRSLCRSCSVGALLCLLADVPGKP